MYGRYARGFADPSSPSANFQLALDRGLWGGLPLAVKKRLAVRVLFFDEGSGQFEVHYGDLSGKTPALIKVKKTNTKSWKANLCNGAELILHSDTSNALAPVPAPARTGSGTEPPEMEPLRLVCMLGAIE